MDKFRSWTVRIVRRFRRLLRARMYAVLLGDADELALDVVSRAAELLADLLQLRQVEFVERESVGGEGFLRIVDQFATELWAFHGAPNHGSDHLVAHRCL